MFALAREPLVAESNRGGADRCPRHSCAASVIPAHAGIHAVCGGQGHSQCSTAPDHPRRAGSCGGPSGGLRLVARLDGRMDSCLRRNDGRGGCDGRGARDDSRSNLLRHRLSVSDHIPPADRGETPKAEGVCSADATAWRYWCGTAGSPFVCSRAREPLVAGSNRGAADRCSRHSCAASVIPAQAGIHAV